MHPQYPTLNFLGFVTLFGNEAATGSLQARWVHALLGHQEDSATPTTVESVQHSCSALRERFLARRPLFPAFVGYIRYADSLAADIGCLPPPSTSAQNWLKDPVLQYRLLFGPMTMAHYNVGAADSFKRDVARRMVLDPNAATLIAKL
mmetsp:Transcript_13752/g.41130  ORF Transcript_13752/g.41130 Transcript_13752/m.41130 type:complete len:148 (-) Transcript_13752:66-509(-)